MKDRVDFSFMPFSDGNGVFFLEGISPCLKP